MCIVVGKLESLRLGFKLLWVCMIYWSGGGLESRVKAGCYRKIEQMSISADTYSIVSP